MVHDKFGIDIVNLHEHHTVFTFQGVSVENHYEFINTKARKSSVALEARFKELAKEDTWTKDEKLYNVYYPSVNLNALFWVKHCASHFAHSHEWPVGKTQTLVA